MKWNDNAKNDNETMEHKNNSEKNNSLKNNSVKNNNENNNSEKKDLKESISFPFWKEGKLPQEKKEKVVILFLLGVFFLLIANPFSKKFEKKEQNRPAEQYDQNKIEKVGGNDAYIEGLENKLEKTIGGMEGAGKVLVMITLKDNGEKILDKNQPYESEVSKSNEAGRESENTSIRSDQETVLIEKTGDTEPIVVQEMYPAIEGVVVVCEGGDDTSLALRIKEAASALFSIDSHKIVVCKLQQ